MRCPDCRHAIAPLRWMRIPDELVCYQCGASLVRSARPGVRDALLIWLVLMLPATLLPLIGGIPGLIAAVALALVVLPRRPWDGLHYTLRAPDRAELPPARALETPARSETEAADRGEPPHPPGAQTP